MRRKLKTYFIHLDTGKITKEKSNIQKMPAGNFETAGYSNAQTVARHCKRKDYEAACSAANHGIYENSKRREK